MPSKSNAPLDELNREGKHIQELIAKISEVPDPSSRAMLEECLESLLRFYGQGLARILELVEEAFARESSEDHEPSRSSP